MIKEIEDKFFVAGQMDAQGTAAEKWKVGSGGPVLAMSQRLLDEARALLIKVELERDKARAQFDRHVGWASDSVPWRDGPPLCTNCGESAKPRPAYADFVGPFCDGCWDRLREYFATAVCPVCKHEHDRETTDCK